MNEQTIRFRLGLFVLAALILLAVLIGLFGGIPSFFQRTDSYTIVFADAMGVSPGTPVRRLGVRIGEARSLALDNATSKVRVLIQVQAGFALRKADRPTIVQGLLGGDAAIAFLPPPQGRGEKMEEGEKLFEIGLMDAAPVLDEDEVVVPGAVLEGFIQTDAQAVVQKTGEVMPQAQEALVEMKKFFQKLDKLMPQFEETTKEFRDLGKTTKELVTELQKTNLEIRELVKATTKSIPDFKRTNEEVQITARQWTKVGERFDILLQTNEDKIVKAIDRLQDTLKRIGDVFSDDNQKLFNDTLKNVKKGSDRFDSIAKGTEDLIKDSRDSLKRVQEALLQAEKVLGNFDKASKPFADRSDNILKNIEESTDKLNRTMTDLREVFQAVARGDGTLQRLLSDPALFQNINDTAAIVNKLLPRVDRILH
ncbi:MAG: MlaD family protein, partial [Gemmataceae bacterium]|nr:MlaD family protein [Gemmataceae bacterium]